MDDTADSETQSVMMVAKKITLFEARHEPRVQYKLHEHPYLYLKCTGCICSILPLYLRGESQEFIQREVFRAIAGTPCTYYKTVALFTSRD